MKKITPLSSPSDTPSPLTTLAAHPTTTLLALPPSLCRWLKQGPWS